MVGLKPEAIEIQLASRFIKNNFHRMNIKQVIRAFELNSTGKYWQTIEHFGSLDSMFIGKVLKAYNEAKRLHAVKHNRSNQKKLPEAPPCDPEKADDWMRKIRERIAEGPLTDHIKEAIKEEPKRMTFEGEKDLIRSNITSMSLQELDQLKKNLEKMLSLTNGNGGIEVTNPYQDLIDDINNEIKQRK